jgi:hypothetical protein
MPPKPNHRNWNDVQTAIATAAIVTTLGMWNLFAEPAKTEIAQAKEQEPVVPPAESPTESDAENPRRGLTEVPDCMRLKRGPSWPSTRGARFRGWVSFEFRDG